jgi:hypothetical protein
LPTLAARSNAAAELSEARNQLEMRVAERTSDLRRREAYLAEAQRLSHTGSFGWSVLSGEIYWSEETYKIFEYDRAVKPMLELVFQRIHPDDRDRVQQTLDRASEARANLDFEHRLLMPDGSVKYLHVLARALETSSGTLEYVGAVTDRGCPSAGRSLSRMAAACGPPVPSGGVQLSSSPCPPRSRRTHNLPSCSHVVANLRILYGLSRTVSTRQSTPFGLGRARLTNESSPASCSRIL